MTAQEVLDRRWGVRTRPITNRLVSSLGTSVTRLIPNDPDRLAWLIVNLSGNTVYLALTRDVSSSKAILLQPSGGSAGMVIDEDFNTVTYEVWGLASAANSAIYTVEVVEY